MKRTTLLGATALGFITGGIFMNARPAYADLPVIDPVAIAQAVKQFAQETGILDVLNAMSTVQTDINKTMSAVNTAIGNTTYGDTNTLLREGFTQDANYSKAQIGAIQGLMDASNTSNARFARDMRNAQIRDEQTASPTHCAAIDGGVSAQAAGAQSYNIGTTIAKTLDLRGEAGDQMPSHFGAAQGVASIAAQHLANYCNGDEQAAGLCTLSATPDADQNSLSLFSAGTYADQAAVDTAKNYAVNLMEPVAPAALRGDQLGSVAGQDAAVQRHAYNARMSLARTFVAQTVGMEAPSVPLTAVQTTYLQNMGIPVPASGQGSWMQVVQIESERRMSDLTWHATLQSMPPAAVEREVATELALNNYLLFQSYKLALTHATISATQLAEETQRNFSPTSSMPTPSVTAAASP